MSIETLERKFTVSGSASLSLSNIRGSVKVRPGEEGEITVNASKHIKTGDPENTRIDLSQTDTGEVKVATRYDNKGFRFFRKHHPCKVDYDVRVPEECTLNLRGVSNSTSVEGISGKKNIKSVSGDVNLDLLKGELRLKTVSGDVDGTKISGAAHLETVSGDIKIMPADFPTLRGKTVSGDLEIESPLGDGPYTFNSVSGDIKFSVPQLRGATIHSHTLSGNVSTSGPVSGLKHSGGNQEIVILDGDVEISHKSVSGDFFLLAENGNGASKENSPLGEVSADHTPSEILAQVAQGDLSVDEAVQMISKSKSN